MKLRYKLTIGISLLFALLLLLGTYSVCSVRRLADASRTILTNNYNSLQYASDMLAQLDRLAEDTTSRESLIRSLALQQENITETNEQEVTEVLEQKIAALTDTVAMHEILSIRGDLYHIMDMNMLSIRSKTSALEAEAAHSVGWLSGVAVVCVVLALLLLLFLPTIVLKPIDKLTQGITSIAHRHYDQRLDLGKDSEFKAAAEAFNDMAAKLNEYRRSSLNDLIMTKMRVEAIVNSLHEPIIGLDPEKQILFINDEACTILNLKREAVMNRNAAEIALNNDLLRRLIRELYVAHKEGEAREPLKIYADAKESYFTMDNIPLYITPIGETEKQFVGNIIMLSNITTYKELDSAKTNFISTISHEMKTPISSILMSLQLLNDRRLGGLNEEQQQLLDSIQTSSDRLLNITGELLNVTQLESGKLQLHPKVVKPIELVDYAIRTTRVLAERFHCFVEVCCPEEKVKKIFVDNEKIAWVITNLLSNAIHHSAENARIIIGIEQGEKTVSIYVQDFGRGIDPRYHKSIFERYFRVPGTKVQGSGLGLAISKEFVEAHAGTISVASEVGQGARFTITLPA